MQQNLLETNKFAILCFIIVYIFNYIYMGAPKSFKCLGPLYVLIRPCIYIYIYIYIYTAVCDINARLGQTSDSLGILSEVQALMFNVSSGGLAVKHPALGARGHRFDSSKRETETIPEINFSAYNIVGG